VGATHRRSRAGRGPLREAAWFPGLAVCPSAGHSKPTFPVHCNQPAYSLQGGPSAPLESGSTVAPALLADVWCTTIVSRLLAAATGWHGNIAAPPYGRTVFEPCHRARPQQSVRAVGERIAPLHDHTGVSQLHTTHPRPSLLVPQACMQVSRQTSEGGHRTCKLSVRYHVLDTDAWVYINM
jgi:hypothetical protein